MIATFAPCRVPSRAIHMTATTTPTKPTFPNASFSAALGKDVTFERLDGADGGPIGSVKDIKIFKAGTFRDSLGRQNTWSAEHLQQMAFHFNLLKANQMLKVFGRPCVLAAQAV